MNQYENTRGENALNIASMMVGFLGVAGSIIAQQNGVTIPESNSLALTLAANTLLGIIQAVKCLPHALELYTIEDPVARKALFGKAFNEMGLAFLNGTSGILCGFVAKLGF